LGPETDETWPLQFLYSGSDDKSIVLHDVRSAPSASALQHGQKSGVATLTGHSSWVLSLSASMSSTHSLLSGSADKTVKVWDARAGGKGGEKGGCVGTFGEAAEVWGVAWRPYEANQAEVAKRFVSAGDERAVRCVYRLLLITPYCARRADALCRSLRLPVGGGRLARSNDYDSLPAVAADVRIRSVPWGGVRVYGGGT
jgi:hypothetical protein